jgi:hypothetical protein
MLLLVQVNSEVPELLDIARFAGTALFDSTVTLAVPVHPKAELPLAAVNV